MGLRFDIHLHTRRHSSCSLIDEKQLIPQAIAKGLDGLVITEHHYQWPVEELHALVEESGCPGFVLLAGFEYTSARGDILVYGLDAQEVNDFEPFQAPKAVVDEVHRRGGVCVAAHPTRAGLGFDLTIRDLALDGIEVASMNLKSHEQRLAQRLAANLGLRSVTASDAHELLDVGAYSIEVDGVIRTVSDLRDCLKHGKFRI